MNDNYVEFSSKCDFIKPQEDDESKVQNFKLLYRNTKNPERDKSSGMSSDDETTSSSLVPIPNTLKQMRSGLKKTGTDLTEHSVDGRAGISKYLPGRREGACEMSPPPKRPKISYVDKFTNKTNSFMSYNETASLNTRKGVLPKPTEKVMQSIEELRKKYTLLNDQSVNWKMNSANLMLDDILNCTNFNKISSENYEELDFKARVAGETETSNTEISTCQTSGCTHFPNVCPHITAPLNFSSPCNMRNRAYQSACDYYGSLEKGQPMPQAYSESSPKEKSLGKKIQGLKGIRAVYHSFLKPKNPFNKNKDAQEGHQGIPDANWKTGAVKNKATVCKCEITSCLDRHYPKKMIFDLVESSENSISDTKTTEKDELACTCKNQRCSCPEVIPKCMCTEYICQVAKETSERPPIKNSQILNTTEKFRNGDGINVTSIRQKNEEETNLIQKEQDDPDKVKKKSLENNNPEWKKYCSKERKYIERTDIYYFDHGNSAYYRTTDNHRLRYTECLVERTDEYATKFWAEIFGFFGIGVAFLISFILQLYRFLFASILRSLTVGLLQIFSDYFFKPLLTVLFNGIIQPCLILAYNVATSFRDLCLPISQSFGFFAKEIANIFRACRLVEINHNRLPCNCGNKV